MPCRTQYGIQNECGDFIFPAGMDPTFWTFYVDDLGIPIPLTQTGLITSFSFQAYRGFTRWEGNKFAHSASHDLQIGGGGVMSYIHRVAVRLISLSVQDDVEFQRLHQGQNIGFVIRNNNDQFLIYGANKGLKAISGAIQTTGTTQTDDPTYGTTFEGVEKTFPIRLLVTDVATTVTYLNARVI
jgi:hypothetical protein